MSSRHDFSRLVALILAISLICAGSAYGQSPADTTVTVRFTALEGRTSINRSRIGDVQLTTLEDANGNERQPRANSNERVFDRGDRIELVLPDTTEIVRISLRGTAGTLVIEQSATPAAAPPGVVWPADGMVDIRRGRVSETIQIPAEIVDPESAPEMLVVSVGDDITDSIALRTTEIAVVARNVSLNSGDTTVQVSSAEGEVLAEGDVPSWGYNVTLGGDGAELDQWVPVFAQVTGLFPEDSVTLQFTPEESQRFVPDTVTITGDEANEPIAVSQFLTGRIGPQALNFVVSHDVADDGAPAGGSD